MNVLGSQNRLAHLIDPKLTIFQAFVFGHCFGLQRGSIFGHPYPKMESGFGFTHAIRGNKLGNKSKTVVLL